jgi:hypothetical protein
MSVIARNEAIQEYRYHVIAFSWIASLCGFAMMDTGRFAMTDTGEFTMTLYTLIIIHKKTRTI